MYHHLSFKNGSNPYICTNEFEFLYMFKKYEIEMLKPGFYLVHDLRKNKTYDAMKAAAESLAIDYSHTFTDASLSWGEVSDLQDIFETLGKRYGLLRDFHENAIC